MRDTRQPKRERVHRAPAGVVSNGRRACLLWFGRGLGRRLCRISGVVVVSSFCFSFHSLYKIPRLRRREFRSLSPDESITIINQVIPWSHSNSNRREFEIWSQFPTLFFTISLSLLTIELILVDSGFSFFEKFTQKAAILGATERLLLCDWKVTFLSRGSLQSKVRLLTVELDVPRPS